MKPKASSVTTHSKKQFLRRIIRNNWLKRSKVDVNVSASTSNQSPISTGKNSNTSDQYASIAKQSSSTEQNFNWKNWPCNEGNIPSTSVQPNFNESRRIYLDTLPYAVLYHLFKYLNAQDLCNLRWSCSNLYRLTHREKKSREDIEQECNGSTPSHSSLLQFSGNLTKTLYISKTEALDLETDLKHMCIEREFFTVLKSFRNLKSLTLENHCLEYEDLYNYLRPQNRCWNLTELKLRGIDFADLNNPSLVFQDLHLHFPSIEVLDVSYCSWVMSNTLWPLSRCLRLKKIITVECSKVDSIFCSVKYSAFFGSSSQRNQSQFTGKKAVEKTPQDPKLPGSSTNDKLPLLPSSFGTSSTSFGSSLFGFSYQPNQPQFAEKKLVEKTPQDPKLAGLSMNDKTPLHPPSFGMSSLSYQPNKLQFIQSKDVEMIPKDPKSSGSSMNDIHRISRQNITLETDNRSDGRPEQIPPDAFLELETLDLRRTHVPLEEIGRFIQLKKLKHVFMEKPEQSLIKRRKLLAFEKQRSHRDLHTNNIFQGQNCYLKTLVLRNYSSITDSIFVEIEQFCKCIEFLDLTGSKCTAKGLARFCSRRPEVNVMT